MAFLVPIILNSVWPCSRHVRKIENMLGINSQFNPVDSRMVLEYVSNKVGFLAIILSRKNDLLISLFEAK